MFKQLFVLRVLILTIVSLLLLSFSRLLLYFFNSTMFNVNFLELLHLFFYGLRFDVSTLCYSMFLFFVLFYLPLPHKIKQRKAYQVSLFIVYLIPFYLVLAPNFIDAVYYRFSDKRFTFDIFSYLSTVSNELRDLILKFIYDYIFVFLLGIASYFVGFFTYKKLIYNRLTKTAANYSYDVKNFLVGTLFFAFVVAVLIIGIRGGLQKKPIGLHTARFYADSKNTPLLINSTFSIIRSYSSVLVEEAKFFSDMNEAKKYFNPIKKYEFSDPKQKKNIVLIILEGFSNEHLKSLNSGCTELENYAPFLDSLIHEGEFFVNCYANGKRSIDAIPAIIASIPSLFNSGFINSPYINNSFESLPLHLRKLGYRSYFFHGGKNGTMNFDAFCAAAGFDKYFGMNEYNNHSDYDGKWGIWDEPFLKYFAHKLNTFAEPFFACVFTLSSHHPYNVPEDFQVKIKGRLPVHKAIYYSDQALRKFFEIAKKQKWYENTIFVITADHTSELVFNNLINNYSIPLLFYEPAKKVKKIYYQTVQQIDIMPSILFKLGYSESFFSFGNNVFDEKSNNFAVFFKDNNFVFLKDSLKYEINEENVLSIEVFKTKECRKYAFSPVNNHNNEVDMLVFKSFMQLYSYSLKNNLMNVQTYARQN